MHKRKYDWKLNAYTGAYIASVTSNVRLVRIGRAGHYLYRAENWGDYSLKFPLRSGWFDNPKNALANLPKED